MSTPNSYHNTKDAACRAAIKASKLADQCEWISVGLPKLADLIINWLYRWRVPGRRQLIVVLAWLGY